MKKLFLFLLMSSFVLNAYSFDHLFHMNEVRINEIENKDNLLGEINNKLAEYIQNKSVFVVIINNDKYNKIYELRKDFYETIYILLYKHNPFTMNYIMVIAIYDESEQNIKSLELKEIGVQKEYRIPPDLFED